MAKKDEPVRSLIIPIEGRNAVLPNLAVAEIINYKEPELQKNKPEWYLGEVEWRGVKVPLISLESIVGGTKAEKKSSRIAIINTTKKNSDTPFYGVVTQGIPHIERIKDNDITNDATEGGELKNILANVVVAGESAYIPDLEAIEASLAKV